MGGPPLLLAGLVPESSSDFRHIVDMLLSRACDAIQGQVLLEACAEKASEPVRQATTVESHEVV
jgi:hypothetical protein